MLPASVFDLTLRTLQGESFPLADLRGQVLLVVNVASQCGFTPQYSGLQALHERYQSEGLRILAFPCNQFGAQEPGDSNEIAHFCEQRYHVRFPIFEKVDVNGAAAHPLFQALKAQAPGALGTESIKWNFTKFLVGRDGTVLDRYGSMTRPEELEADIERALAAPVP